MSTIENAPLVEVVFEILWGDIDELGYSQNEIDLPQTMAGLLSNIGFTWHDNLFAREPQRPEYRFHAMNERSPCVQLGKGILSVNMLGNPNGFDKFKNTKTYDWYIFRKHVRDVVEMFDIAYEDGLKALRNPVVSLKFLDAFNMQDQDPISVIESALRAPLPHAKEIISLSGIRQDSFDLNFNFSFKCIDPSANINISYFTGRVADQEAFLIETQIVSKFENGSTDPVSVMEWLDKSHLETKPIFKSLLKRMEF